LEPGPGKMFPSLLKGFLVFCPAHNCCNTVFTSLLFHSPSRFRARSSSLPLRGFKTLRLAPNFSHSFIALIMLSSILHIALGLVSFASTTFGHGTSCTTTQGPGTASPDAPFWLESIKHQGISAYNPDPDSYQVFRNVKDFGAQGEFRDL
jgi:hypothetical protein